jgi:hypothetical protein
LKPDMIGPGVNILAAWTGVAGPTGLAKDGRRTRFNIISGEWRRTVPTKVFRFKKFALSVPCSCSVQIQNFSCSVLRFKFSHVVVMLLLACLELLY